MLWFLARIFRLAHLEWTRLLVSKHGFFLIGTQMALAWIFAALCSGHRPEATQLAFFWKSALLILSVYLLCSVRLWHTHKHAVVAPYCERVVAIGLTLFGMLCLQVIGIALLLAPLVYYQDLSIATLFESISHLFGSKHVLPPLQSLALAALDQVALIEREHLLSPLEAWYIEFIFPIALPSILATLLFLARSSRRRRARLRYS